MIEGKLIRCAANAPNRCQSSSKFGQCPYTAEEGSESCPRHAANKHRQSAALRDAKMYRLSQYQARMEEFATSDGVKSLRAEIGIARMTLETVLSTCNNPALFAINAGRISDLVMKIEKLVMSCNRLEISAGEMLDKSKAMQLAQALVEAVGRHITDPDILEALSADIQQQIGELTIF